MKNILTMKNIVKTFGSGHTEVTALKGINFNVKQENLSASSVPLVQERVLS